MSYTVSYTAGARADEKAIKDCRDYLGERFHILEQAIKEAGSVDGAFMSCGFAGIRGYPAHALLRKYRLADYRDWMHAGDDAVMTDDAGFPV